MLSVEVMKGEIRPGERPCLAVQVPAFPGACTSSKAAVEKLQDKWPGRPFCSRSFSSIRPKLQLSSSLEEGMARGRLQPISRTTMHNYEVDALEF